RERPWLALISQDYERLEADRNVLRGPLRIGGRGFEHGLGTHSVSRIRLRSPRPIARLSASIGVDDNAITHPGPGPGIGTAVFSIDADGREVYRSPTLRGGDEPERVDLDVRGARLVDLRVGDGGDGPACDHADWADAAIV